MGAGTTLNNVYARRIHRSNAREVAEQAESMLDYYRDRLMILAASPPHNVDEGDGPMPWDFYVRREIDGMWDEIQEHVLDGYHAQFILDNPRDVVDDYDDPIPVMTDDDLAETIDEACDA